MSNSRNLASLLRADGSVEPTKYTDEIGGVADFVASGILPNGQAVILKDDGTVSAITIPTTTVPTNMPAGSEYIFDSGPVFDFNIAFDPNTANTFVVTYRDAGNGSAGTAIVGTIVSNTITFGAPVVFNAGDAYGNSISFDPNTAGKFIVAFRDVDNGYYGALMIGTVSGTSISFGSKYVFSSVITTNTRVVFDPHNANKFLVIYEQSHGHARIGTVSGSSITFGSAYPYQANTAYESDVSFHPNQANKIVIAYKRSSKGYAVIGTISGTSITYGTESMFTNQHYYNSVAFDPNSSNIVVAFSDHGNGMYGTAILGTVVGTNITFNGKFVYLAAYSGSNNIAFDPYGTTGKFVISTMDETGGAVTGTMITGTISGTTLVYDAANAYSASAWLPTVAFNPNNIGEFVAVFAPGYNTNGKAVVGQVGGAIQSDTNLTADNFIGISSATYADGETATVTLAGSVSDNQTGLTINSTYYVQTDGTIATTADTPSVELGRAISSTSLLLTSEAGAAPAVVADTALSAYGGTTSEYGIYKVHTFTTSGNFSVTANGGDVDVFIVGAGAAGGGDFGGGGGAGNAYSTSGRTVSPNTNYPITIGGGGVGGTSIGGNGSNTNAFGVVASGGGGGGRHNLATPVGGANGGGGGGDSSRSGAVGSIASYADWTNHGGFSGGNGTQHAGGGGGGAGGAGVAGTTSAAGNGGLGHANDFNGSSLYWAAGGGGGTYGISLGGDGGDGGIGGGGGGSVQQTSESGGTGGSSSLNSGEDGSAGNGHTPTNNSDGGSAGAHTGSGGGGAGYMNMTGGNGASGIVIVRYLK